MPVNMPRRAPSRGPRTLRIALILGEVRTGETGNPTGTFSVHTALLSLTGSHCEAPLVARCCRVDGYGSTDVDGLRQWGR
ncbi:hypothetical protein GCM10010104_35700 [Streptomyces indiaensis]|uniref:Uncharacterized protein n=1 Tax=Streptomyces indiaensis TaxID=284033 RepID=A0ABP5QMT6_9ACTN